MVIHLSKETLANSIDFVFNICVVRFSDSTVLIYVNETQRNRMVEQRVVLSSPPQKGYRTCPLRHPDATECATWIEPSAKFMKSQH